MKMKKRKAKKIVEEAMIKEIEKLDQLDPTEGEGYKDVSKTVVDMYREINSSKKNVLEFIGAISVPVVTTCTALILAIAEAKGTFLRLPNFFKVQKFK